MRCNPRTVSKMSTGLFAAGPPKESVAEPVSDIGVPIRAWAVPA